MNFRALYTLYIITYKYHRCLGIVLNPCYFWCHHVVAIHGPTNFIESLRNAYKLLLLFFIYLFYTEDYNKGN